MTGSMATPSSALILPLRNRGRAEWVGHVVGSVEAQGVALVSAHQPWSQPPHSCPLCPPPVQPMVSHRQRLGRCACLLPEPAPSPGTFVSHQTHAKLTRPSRANEETRKQPQQEQRPQPLPQPRAAAAPPPQEVFEGQELHVHQADRAGVGAGCGCPGVMSVKRPRVVPQMTEWSINITEFSEMLQDECQCSTKNISTCLKKIAARIQRDRWPSPRCYRMANIIVRFLSEMKPDIELQELCTAVLTAVGFRCPGDLIETLLQIEHQPPKSILLAVEKICGCDAMAPYIDKLWVYILDLLKKNRMEEDTMAIYGVLHAVVDRDQHYRILKFSPEERFTQERHIRRNAWKTFKLLRERWSPTNGPEMAEKLLLIFSGLFSHMPLTKVKTETEWFIEELKNLIPSCITPVCISKCVISLLNVLRLGHSGGFNKDSQVYSTVDLLLKLLSMKLTRPDVQDTLMFTWRAFLSLFTLHGHQVVHSLLENMKSENPDIIQSVLRVFTNAFQYVPETDELKSELVPLTAAVIRRDFPSVRNTILEFVPVLIKHDYLVRHQGNELLLQLIRLTFTEYSVQTNLRVKSLKLLTMVSVPQLLTVVCHPKNYMTFSSMGLMIMEKVRSDYFWEHDNYLRNFHLNSNSQFISPQKLLLHLVMLSSQPYRADGVGSCALMMLEVLQPITPLRRGNTNSFSHFCWKEIPQLLEMLNGHSQHTLNQEEWEQRLLEFSRNALVAINDNAWLKQLLLVTMEKIRNSDPFYVKDKAFLYQFFGFTLRTSRGKRLVNKMVYSLLQTPHQKLLEREGIAMALSVLSRSHLELILNQLQVYGAALTDKYSSTILDLTKDTNMKLDYLTALAKMTTSLCELPFAPATELPSIEELEHLVMQILKEEPMESLSSSMKLRAINIIADLRKIKRVADWNAETAAQLQTICKCVLRLPSAYKICEEGSNYTEGKPNAVLYGQTLQSFLRLLQTLVEERPSALEEMLEEMERWMNSRKPHVRERAMWCISELLHYVAYKQSFKTKITFTKLECLVKLLALHCHDEVDKVSFQSSQVAYQLYRILLQQKEMERNKLGLLSEERTGETCSAAMFYKDSTCNIAGSKAGNVAKAFAEFFSEPQLNNLVLWAMDSLKGEATVSLVSAQLLSAILKERAGDVVQVEEVGRGILCHLDSTPEPRTKEELLHAMCWLAGQRTSTTVPLLLNQPLPWDRTKLAIWDEFGKDRETALHVLRVLTNTLEKRPPNEDSREMDIQPEAVSCALLEVLTDSVCQEAAQELFPRLLLALLCHVHWTVQKNSPQQAVVSRKKEDVDSKTKAFDPLSCALQAVRALILAADYSSVVVCAEHEKCWDKLASPEHFYIGVITLTRAIVRNCPIDVIQQILTLTLPMLDSPDFCQKLLAQSVYVQLLWHKSVADTLGQECLRNIEGYLKDPDPVVKEIGLLGMSSITLHPKLPIRLRMMAPVLKELRQSTPRLKMQTIEAYRSIVMNTNVRPQNVFWTTCKELHLLVNDERIEVRISATSLLGDILKKMKRSNLGSPLKKKIHTFLVPLLLNFQSYDMEMLKVCRKTLKRWSQVTSWRSLTSVFKNINHTNHTQVIESTMRHLVRKNRTDMLGKILSESLVFLKNQQPFLRMGALTLIDCILKSLSELNADDAATLKSALRELSDPMPCIQQLTATALARIDSIPAFKVESSFPRRLFRMLFTCTTGYFQNDEREEKQARELLSRVEAPAKFGWGEPLWF